MAKRQKATVLYATETGKSENFAKILANALSKAFDVKIFCMDEYKFSKLDQENLLMIVTSTFGNGEAPRNGEVCIPDRVKCLEINSIFTKLTDFLLILPTYPSENLMKHLFYRNLVTCFTSLDIRGQGISLIF